MVETTKVPKSTKTMARNIGKRFFRHENALLATVLIVIVGVMAFVTGGKTISQANIKNIFIQSTNRGLASIGQAMVVLSGGIDLSVGGVGLFSAVLGALLLTQTLESTAQGAENIIGYSLPTYIVIPTMLAVGAGWGAINGTLVSRVGIPSLIVTLGTWQIARGATFLLSEGYGVTNLPESLAFLGRGTIAGVPVPAIIFISVAIIVYFVLYHTTFGHSIYAVGGNQETAWLSGINVKAIRSIVLVISGFLAALAAVVSTSRAMSASMQSLQGLEIDTIAAVFIGGISLAGGKGTLIGVILGVFIIGAIDNGMSVLGAPTVMKTLVKGAIIIGAVVIDNIRRK